MSSRPSPLVRSVRLLGQACPCPHFYGGGKPPHLSLEQLENVERCAQVEAALIEEHPVTRLDLARHHLRATVQFGDRIVVYIGRQR